MKILKFKNGNLNLKLEPNYDKSKYSDYTLDEILNNDDLFMNNLYFKVDDGGTLWIIDYNKKLAYDIADCFHVAMWNKVSFFNRLLIGRTVKIRPYGSIGDVKEYFSGNVI